MLYVFFQVQLNLVGNVLECVIWVMLGVTQTEAGLIPEGFYRYAKSDLATLQNDGGCVSPVMLMVIFYTIFFFSVLLISPFLVLTKMTMGLLDLVIWICLPV